MNNTDQQGVKEFRKKSVVIQAIQWDGTYHGMKQIETLFPELITTACSCHKANDTVTTWSIKTLEGHYYVSHNDFIIKGIKGEFYPCKLDIFEKSYEALQSLSGKENKIPDDFYPGYEYQNLFNWLSDKNFIALQSEMQELIEIVHRDFPKEQSGDQLSAGIESQLYKAAYNLMLFIGDDGEPFDGFRFREQARELQKAVDDYKPQPEDTHIMLNRLQEYGNRGRDNGDAIEFAEWCGDNNYIYTEKGMWFHDVAEERIMARVASAHVYNLYLQSKQKANE